MSATERVQEIIDGLDDDELNHFVFNCLVMIVHGVLNVRELNGGDKELFNSKLLQVAITVAAQSKLHAKGEYDYIVLPPDLES